MSKETKWMFTLWRIHLLESIYKLYGCVICSNWIHFLMICCAAVRQIFLLLENIELVQMPCYLCLVQNEAWNRKLISTDIIWVLTRFINAYIFEISYIYASHTHILTFSNYHYSSIAVLLIGFLHVIIVRKIVIGVVIVSAPV